jgi:hypothetical protein
MNEIYDAINNLVNFYSEHFSNQFLDKIISKISLFNGEVQLLKEYLKCAQHKLEQQLIDKPVQFELE